MDITIRLHDTTDGSARVEWSAAIGDTVIAKGVQPSREQALWATLNDLDDQNYINRAIFDHVWLDD